jgi:hypothetical protein
MRDTPGDPLSAREDAPRTRRWSGVIEGVFSWADRASSDGEVGADCGDVRMIVANCLQENEGTFIRRDRLAVAASNAQMRPDDSKGRPVRLRHAGEGGPSFATRAIPVVASQYEGQCQPAGRRRPIP